MKKEYKIGVTWEAWGYITVEAESLEEAIEYVIDEASLPTDWDYLDDSIRIDTNAITTTPKEPELITKINNLEESIYKEYLT